MDNDCIYLMSSNATKEYITDIFEVLSLPSEIVMHFRYQIRWLDENLKAILPIKNKSQASELKNKKVVICYLYQEKQDSGWEWIIVYPIRTGVLTHAYKSGDKNEDVAHFYFKVNNYIRYGEQDFTRVLKEIACEKWGKAYALIGSMLDNTYIAYKGDSKSAFIQICNSLNSLHLRSPEGNEYFPMFCFMEGFKDKKGKILLPEYDPLTLKSFYKLTEGEYYSFGFSTYFTLKPPQYVVKLLSDEKIFSTPPVYELKASSRYDEESYTIISSILERDAWTSFSFKTELPDRIDNKESLNIHFEFPIKVERKILYRIFDVLSDVGFGVGTAAIALKAAFPPSEMTWWYWPAISGYSLWAIIKITIKFWRG
ncbi:hypothetical protein [Rosettibacter firmus]|uniref:hypothetical protein n=1 Tax=Rosettibacter firmus TaxID=3111522 RepID=UPI00336C0D08